MFIVFEGIDGCGKSTQVFKLAKFLSSINKHNHVLITREPYKQKEIRKILKSSNDPNSERQLLTKLFVQDRREHLNELIIPNLQKNIIVISDRYKYSTIAYQSAQGENISGLIDMHKDMMTPDFVFIIDTPAQIAEQRMKSDLNQRENTHKFEKNLDFLESVRKNYLKMKYLPKEKIIIIDGTKSIDEIFSEIKEYFKVFN